MRNARNVEALREHADVRVFHVELPGSALPPDAGADAEIHRLPLLGRHVLAPLLPGSLFTDAFRTASVASALQRVLAEFRPDAAVLEEPWLHRYLPVLRPAVGRLIVDFHNVEACVYRDILAQPDARGVDRLRARLLLRAALAAEEDCARAADMLWTCSAEDAALCASRHPGVRIGVVPNGIDPDANASPRAGAHHAQPPRMLLCAEFGYFPNRQAAHAALELLPRIRARVPGARLQCVGRHPSRAMLRAARADPGVEVTGGVPDVLPYLHAATLALIPLRVGGGTRLKILEAMAAGCPVAATPKAVEGLGLRDGVEALLGEDGALADAVVRLCADASLRGEIAARALARVRAAHAPRVIADAVGAALESAGVTKGSS